MKIKRLSDLIAAGQLAGQRVFIRADLNVPQDDAGRITGYLSPEERAEAPRLYRHLSAIRDALLSGDNRYAVLEKAAADDLTAHGWRVDYIEVRQADTLEIAHAGESRLVVLAAARLGRTRLIDNIEVTR